MLGRRGWAVEEGPEHAYLADGFYELFEFYGFDDVGVDAELVAFGHVGFFLGRGHDDDGDDFQTLVGLDLPQDIFLGLRSGQILQNLLANWNWPLSIGGSETAGVNHVLESFAQFIVPGDRCWNIGE